MTKTQTPAQESLQLSTPEGSATNVEKYEFEPIKGYPMLNWRGKRPSDHGSFAFWTSLMAAHSIQYGQTSFQLTPKPVTASTTRLRSLWSY